MAINFGIATVDATGYDYSSSSSQTIAGLYQQTDKAYKSGMPILLHGWDYNNVQLSPMFVYVMPTTDAYIIDGKISVSSADSVTRL